MRGVSAHSRVQLVFIFPLTGRCTFFPHLDIFSCSSFPDISCSSHFVQIIYLYTLLLHHSRFRAVLTSLQATLDAFPPSSKFTISPQTTIEDVFSAVQSSTAYRGVIPFENSSNGSVVFTLDLFADLGKMYPDILVCGEAYVAVKHCLLGYSSSPDNASSKDEASPKDGGKWSDMSRVKTLYSHPQAWGQCKTFLSTHLQHAERRDVSSTSKAAQIASQDKSGESAALSSIAAADLFGLHVLANGINDRVGNTTRFLVIRHRSSNSLTTSSEVGNGNGKQDNSWKSLITFTVDHAYPGALAHCLSAFSKQGLNLTSINTRPSGVANWNYIFFVEFKGRKKEDDGEGGCAVDKALGELEKVCKGYRWLGSWENGLDGSG
jgi:prephenate dehydratase